MAHSKRNTSLAYFTHHERSLLKGTWGSQSTRLNRESFLPFASCNLCLQASADPVACSSNGEVFCRECIVNNLLAQRKEIKRLEKDDERRRAEDVEREREKGEEDGRRAVEEFERTMMGLEGKRGKGGEVDREREKQVGKDENKGVKRKFELDEEEMMRNVREDRAKARQAIEDEKSSRGTLPSFWIPSMTPSTENGSTAIFPLKLQPLCPLSSPTNKHNISLKTLVSIKFTEGSSQSSHSSKLASYICPACNKNLSNTSKAVMTLPCGHVLCKACAGKFMSSSTATTDPHAPPDEQKTGHITCYVCEMDLTAQPKSKKDGNKGDRNSIKPGLVELKSEGTGFASGGDNMISQKGTAFQC